MSLPRRYRTSGVYVLLGAAGIVFVAALISLGESVNAQTTATPADLRIRALTRTNSLKTVPVLDAPNFAQFVRDRVALRKLGKALFWDQQIGSDGQACASCHFHAGADNRSINQLNPGFRDQTPGVNTHAFTPPFGPNYQLTAADFPFHRLLDVNNRASKVTFDTNDVASSQGVFNADFTAIGIPGDIGVPSLTGGGGHGVVFNVNGALVRNVEPRNTPTVVNAALNHRNFWDGRARFEFNGVNPIGALDDTAQVVHVASILNMRVPHFKSVRIGRSSAASQADGPPLSDLEMSFFGRRFPEVGRKMLRADLVALGQQIVAPTDSLLGAHSKYPNRGIALNYRGLIQQAFLPEWWDAAGLVVDLTIPSLPFITLGTPGPDRFTVIEFNFSLFFGMAVNEYEKTLIADDTRFDRFMEGNLTALTASEQGGLAVFLDQGKCINCHGGAELTNASLSNVQPPQIIERMIMGDNRVAVYDNGFYNIGVRPTLEDIGVGGTIGPDNLPLSNSRFFQMQVRDEVRRLMAANPTLTRDAAVRLANANAELEIPRILARPGEAAKLLSRAAALLGNPPDIVSLIAQANAMLAAVPPDPTGASKLLVLARDLLLARKAAPSLQASVASLARAATSLLPDPIDPGPDPQQPLGPPLDPDERVAVDGALKTATVRGVALTAPYFHNGGQLTLRQVVDFYNRGGDFAVQNQQNLDPDIQPLFLTEQQKVDLVAFLKSLTDQRVVFDRAPFDHPSLNVPNGGSGVVTLLFGFPVMDDRIVVPAVGAAGNAVPLGTANTPFANFLQPLK
jgi:cytochrome c peroxidase